MSSCLVLQAKDKLYIGADTSSSVFIDDKLYRLNNNTKKLFSDACAYYGVPLMTAQAERLGQAIGQPGRKGAADAKGPLGEKRVSLAAQDRKA